MWKRVKTRTDVAEYVGILHAGSRFYDGHTVAFVAGQREDRGFYRFIYDDGAGRKIALCCRFVAGCVPRYAPVLVEYETEGWSYGAAMPTLVSKIRGEMARIGAERWRTVPMHKVLLAEVFQAAKRDFGGDQELVEDRSASRAVIHFRRSLGGGTP